MSQPPPPPNQPPAGTPHLPPPGGQPPPPGYPPPGNQPPAFQPPGYQPPGSQLPGSQPPGFQPPPPGFQPPPPGSFPPGGPQQAPKKGRGCLIAALVVGAILILGVGAIVVLSIVAVDSIDEAIQEAQDDAARQEDAPSGADSSGDAGSGDQADEPAGGDEANDVGPCVVIDAETIKLDVTNNSSKQSSYLIDVNFLDAGGQRVGNEPFFVNNVRPSERTLEESYAFGLEGATLCEIAKVERFASESPDDTSEVTCEITGVDFLDDVTTDLVATNGSSELSDYSIDFSVVRDGVRTGTGFATIENIRPGESAPGEGLSFAPGPAEGAVCEVVSVSRTAS